jgi:NTE family protein
MRQALVLGGGGVIGVAWESGILRALVDAGIERSAFGAVVGTSAGAIIGARFLAGHDLVARPGSPEGGGSGPDSPALIDPKALDLAALGRVFQIWGANDRMTPAVAAEIGGLARTLYRDKESAWVTGITRAAGANGWPDTTLRISAVDTESGARALFDHASGVDLARAIAASSSVPAIFPSVTIDGRLYMDGGVHSSTHADALVGDRPARVLVLMPMNARTAQHVGAHAERALDAEVAALRGAGSEVFVRTPTAEDASRMGPNLMDFAKTSEAFEVGLATGRALARELG